MDVGSGLDVPAEFRELVDFARAIQGKFALRRDFDAGSVAAALRSRTGRIYTGICLDMACGIGFCAEHAAVAEMLKARETEIAAVVAIGKRGILAPCGRCRELMAQINPTNMGTRVLLPGMRIASLDALLPDHWLTTLPDPANS